MTVVTSLDELSMSTSDFVDAVANDRFEQLTIDDGRDSGGQRREVVSADGYGRGVRERYSYTVQPFKPRNSRLARFEALATVMVAVCLYALTFVALLNVIQNS